MSPAGDAGSFSQPARVAWGCASSVVHIPIPLTGGGSLFTICRMRSAISRRLCQQSHATISSAMVIRTRRSVIAFSKYTPCHRSVVGKLEPADWSVQRELGVVDAYFSASSGTSSDASGAHGSASTAAASVSPMVRQSEYSARASAVASLRLSLYESNVPHKSRVRAMPESIDGLAKRYSDPTW